MTFKIIILGDSGVGKTSLLHRYIDDRFNRNYKATIGADFSHKDIRVDNRLYTLQLWDTAGQERFQSLGTSFYRGADGCIVVYDLHNRRSQEHVRVWKDEFLINTNCDNPEEYPFVTLGNKADLEYSPKGESKIDSLFYTSALTGAGIDAAMEAIVRKIIARKHSLGDFSVDYDTISLNRSDKVQDKKDGFVRGALNSVTGISPRCCVG